jgi:hypothetical protein
MSQPRGDHGCPQEQRHRADDHREYMPPPAAGAEQTHHLGEFRIRLPRHDDSMAERSRPGNRNRIPHLL